MNQRNLHLSDNESDSLYTIGYPINMTTYIARFFNNLSLKILSKNPMLGYPVINFAVEVDEEENSIFNQDYHTDKEVSSICETLTKTVGFYANMGIEHKLPGLKLVETENNKNQNTDFSIRYTTVENMISRALADPNFVENYRGKEFAENWKSHDYTIEKAKELFVRDFNEGKHHVGITLPEKNEINIFMERIGPVKDKPITDPIGKLIFPIIAKNQLTYITIHEIGHIFGLDHENSNQIMHPKLSPDTINNMKFNKEQVELILNNIRR